MKMRLIDDGRRTYRTVNEFEWDGPVQETPWGPAAYVGNGSPEPMATGRNGGFFGVANGRAWSAPPAQITKTVDGAKYNLNAQDIYEVHPEFGGGYISYGRHDIGPATPCPFGVLYQRRVSVGEMKHHSPILETVFIDHSGIMFDTRESWADEYRGDGNFILETETLTGTRAELEIPGMSVRHMGWTLENNAETRFVITRETVRDNNGIFAIRNIPIRRA